MSNHTLTYTTVQLRYMQQVQANLTPAVYYLYSTHRFYKDDTAPDIYRSMFYEICDSYDNFDHIYTDGSKMGDRVASAAICSNVVRSTRLPNNASIFRAELYAITLAMYFVHRSRNSNFVILSDSMSSPEALNGVKFELDLVRKIIKDYIHLTNNGKTIIFCWITSHVNIPGNEIAHAAAKSSLSFPITKMKLPAYDLIPRVSKPEF